MGERAPTCFMDLSDDATEVNAAEVNGRNPLFNDLWGQSSTPNREQFPHIEI